MDINSLEKIRDFLKRLFSESEKEKKKSYVDFREWLFGIITKCLTYLTLILLVAKALGILDEIVKIIMTIPYDPYFFSFLIHIVVILLVILLPVKTKLFSTERLEEELPKKEKVTKAMMACGFESEKDWCKAKGIANRALESYKTKWYLIWVFWLLLYITLLSSMFNKPLSPIFDVLLNLFNNAATLMFIICYLILAKVTVSDDRTGITETPQWIPWFTIFLIITLLDVFLTYLGGNQTQAIASSKIIRMITGIGGGTVMALFVGRFDSKFINAPLLVLILLYAYAVIQALFFILPEFKYTLYIVNVALSLKLLFFLFMSWLFQSGKLLFYFIRIRKLHYRVEEDWEQFCDFFHGLDETTGNAESNLNKNKSSKKEEEA
jgi:hypothetical protein